MREKNMRTEDFDKADNIIVKYLAGNATAEEILLLEEWIRESEENQKYFRQLKNIWDSSVDLHISTDKALKKVMQQINPGARKITFWQLFQRIAAVVFIPLVLTVLWLGLGKDIRNGNSTISYHKVVAAFGTYSILELPDGSKVWLNSGSTLRYPEKFDNENRIV